MNKLRCKVSTCSHNQNELCTLNKIQVEGPAANESKETCCISYTEKSKSASNEVGSSGKTASEKTDICCCAENCAYNENKKCSAENVCVDGCCCNPCVVSETECSTFRPRA